MIDITEIMDVNKFSELYCNVCNNLLSVPPILLTVHGKNVCGRCESEVPAEKTLRNVQFEILARHLLFPCRFKKEDCAVKKTFNEMKGHEEICPYQTKQCPIQTCQWNGIATELIIHFKKHHETFLTDTFEKQQVEGVSGCILTVEGFYFLIEWCRTAFEFNLTVNYLNLLFLDCDVRCSYRLESVEDVQTELTTELFKLNESLTLNLLAATSLILTVNPAISESDCNKQTEVLNKIICPNCQCKMIPPILVCPAGHLTCVDCTDSDYDYCIICDADEIHFKQVPELNNLAISTIYNCKHCAEEFSVRDIEEHQRVCNKRLYMCLHCPVWKGVLTEIGAHYSMCNSEYICPMFINMEIAVQGMITDVEEYSLITHKEQFYVAFNSFPDGTVKVVICNCGPPSLFGWYFYEVILHHSEDECSSFNKRFILRSKFSKKYEVTIPACEFAKFGGNLFTKITVKVNLLSGSERSQNVARHYKWFK